MPANPDLRTERRLKFEKRYTKLKKMNREELIGYVKARREKKAFDLYDLAAVQKIERDWQQQRLKAIFERKQTKRLKRGVRINPTEFFKNGGRGIS